MARTKLIKARYFTFLLYPESLPHDWKTRLITLGLPMAISPLHNRDKKEKADITSFEDACDLAENKDCYKKEHYHCILVNPNPLTTDAILKKIQRKLGADTVALVKVIDNVKYLYDYLSHESIDAIEKKKHKYDKKDIVLLNNFDIDRYIVMDEAEKKEKLNAILNAIHQNALANMFDLVEWINEYGKEIGVVNMNIANDVMKSNMAIVRSYFDGAYQCKKTIQ